MHSYLESLAAIEHTLRSDRLHAEAGLDLTKRIPRRKKVGLPHARQRLRFALLPAIVALGLLAGSAHAASAPTTAVAALNIPAASSFVSSVQPACWASGDLVGDANPATVHTALCGAASPMLP